MKNLKKTYFRQVKRALQCDRKTRKRILHDLSEAFDAARRDGKTETETIALLGNAQELAQSFPPFPDKSAQRKNRTVGAAALLSLAAAILLFLIDCGIRLHATGVPIGGADQATGIQIIGSATGFAERLPGTALFLLLFALLLGMVRLTFLILDKKGRHDD